MRRRCTGFEDSISFPHILRKGVGGTLPPDHVPAEPSPGANSFSFKQNKRLHYSGCHLPRDGSPVALPGRRAAHLPAEMSTGPVGGRVLSPRDASESMLGDCTASGKKENLSSAGCFSADVVDGGEPERYPSRGCEALRHFTADSRGE